ncbi:hypothetical protein DPMN_109012 [Dreissena polymorpha]|uniref:Uncharacterized protein n=1 Tax=Dreissena polymorpha TaxID=45954 RepID=A0A9D4K9Z6_DREPO|nr:hypothetical protein DPMN_109012 [Dreissena polymorpha]
MGNFQEILNFCVDAGDKILQDHLATCAKTATNRDSWGLYLVKKSQVLQELKKVYNPYLKPDLIPVFADHRPWSMPGIWLEKSTVVRNNLTTCGGFELLQLADNDGLQTSSIGLVSDIINNSILLLWMVVVTYFPLHISPLKKPELCVNFEKPEGNSTDERIVVRQCEVDNRVSIGCKMVSEKKQNLMRAPLQ